MTTAPTMLPRALTLALCLCILLPLSACYSQRRPLVQPAVVLAPYNAHNPEARGERLWAVAPLRNESGTTAADPLAISDQLVSQLTQVNGIAALPMNRTLGAMQALGISSIDSPAHALAVARALKADAIVVGSITSYEPYQPLRFGINIVVLGDSPTMFPLRDERAGADELMEFRKAQTDLRPSNAHDPRRPLSSVAVMLDADNHAVLAEIQRFAAGRVDADSALGWEAYTRSMARFIDFACFRAAELLMASEAQRLADAGADNQVPPR